jgi:hypothetical protein
MKEVYDGLSKVSHILDSILESYDLKKEFKKKESGKKPTTHDDKIKEVLKKIKEGDASLEELEEVLRLAKK